MADQLPTSAPHLRLSRRIAGYVLYHLACFAGTALLFLTIRHFLQIGPSSEELLAEGTRVVGFIEAHCKQHGAPADMSEVWNIPGVRDPERLYGCSFYYWKNERGGYVFGVSGSRDTWAYFSSDGSWQHDTSTGS